MYQLFYIIGYWVATLVLVPIINGFGTALDWVSEKFHDIFYGIRDFVGGIINNIIDFINTMVGRITEGINGIIGFSNLVGNLIPGYEGMGFVTAPSIPHLATGAVIPNIEAPANLIRQIVSEEIGKITADINIEFGGSLASLVRELRPYIQKEDVRVGGSLVTSGVTI
jgi:hypothetical protein